MPALAADLSRRAVRRRRTARWLGAGASALAVAATALLLVGRESPPGMRTERPAWTGRKGGSDYRLGFYYRRADRVFPGRNGAVLHPGDQVRFVCDLPQDAYVTVLGRDAAGAVTVYFPADGAAEPLPAGREQALPNAIELDAQLGPEMVHGVFCERPVPATRLQEMVRAAPLSPRWPAGCSSQHLGWSKQLSIDHPAE